MATDEKGRDRLKDLHDKPVSPDQAEEVKGGFGKIVKGISKIIGGGILGAPPPPPPPPTT